jgi:hypothetical protein
MQSRISRSSVSLGVALLTAASTMAGSFSITKVTTWDVTKVTKNGNNIERKENVGADTGYSRYSLHAFAADKHKTDHLDKPTVVNLQGEKLDTQFASAFEQKAYSKTNPSKSDHFWTKKENFDQGKNLAATKDITAAFSEHPSASASVTLSTVRQGAILPHGNFATQSIIQMNGSAEIGDVPKAHAPEFVYTDTMAIGEIKLTGSVLDAVIRQQGMAPEVSKSASGTLRGRTDAQKNDKTDPVSNRATWNDPLSLSVYNDETGEFLAKQDLFFEDWLADDDASMTWDSTGLELITGPDGGVAAVNLTALGDWVLNPFSGSARLDNGTLDLAGVFVGLNWSVTSMGGMTRAFLSASEFSNTKTISVLPTGSWGSDTQLRLDWTSDSQGFTSRYLSLVVPEPGTIGLSLLGMAIITACINRSRGVRQEPSVVAGESHRG